MIRLENAILRYGKNEILRIDHLCFDSPGIYPLLGINGAGKSTLLKAIAGIMPYEGSITINGKEIRDLHHRERARLLAYLPQQLPSVDLRAEELIAMGRYAWRNRFAPLHEEDRRAIREAAEKTGVTHLLDRCCAELSGGERQRVWIAMAAAQKAGILLLDEPETYMDPEAKLTLYEEINKLKAEGICVIMASHSLASALSIADEVTLLHEKKSVFHGSPEEMIRSSLPYDIYGVRIEKNSDPDAVDQYYLTHRGGH